MLLKKKDRCYTSAAGCQSNIRLDLQCWDHPAETLAPSGSVFDHIEILHQIFFLKPCTDDNEGLLTALLLFWCQFWALQQENGWDQQQMFHPFITPSLFLILRIWKGTSGSPTPRAGISLWSILANHRRILENRLHRISTLLRPSIILSIIGGCRRAHFIDCLVIKCTAGDLFWLDLTTSY